MKLSIITTVALLAAGPVAGQAAAQTSAATQVRATDEQLSAEIATKIANHETLKADAVKVNVKNGVVTLSGVVGKDVDKTTAEQLARVDGVVRVENNLKSREKATDAVAGTAGTVASKTKEGAEKTVDASKKVAGKTKEVFSKSGEKITDGWITSRIKTKFMADDTLQASAINVDTRDHVVTLKGAVPTEAARMKAMDLAKEVEGVDRVVDSLKVTSK
jgi:hyperosmotically inducible periplasmic protein